MGGRKKQTVGHRYFFGIHMGAGRGPMDELVEIKVGDRTAWSGSVTASSTIQINKPDLFGGDDKEGGIVGPLDVMMGRPDQAVNPRLAAMLGGLVPAFRGVASLFFDGLMCSGSPYPKPWTMRWRRALQGWDGEPWYPVKAVVELTGPDGALIKAMNPAHILYECFTNADWGRGLARSRLDDARWRSAADALFDEGFGLCMAWQRQDSLASFMQGVLDHIGATLFADPFTGLVVLDLIRDDYVVADLPLFDADSGLLSIDDDDAAAQGSSVNEVVVRYRSPLDGKPRQVRVKNPAAIHAMDGVSSTTKDYLGIPTAELALRVAQRDLRAASGFVKKFKVRLDRRGSEILPGRPFRIRDLARGIGTMVLRAGRVEHGPLGDDAITVTAAQDVFGLPSTSYVDVQAGGWVAPQTTPAAVVTQAVLELPYRDLVATGAAVPDGGAGLLGAAALAPSPVSLEFQLRTRPALAGAYALAGSGSFCPGGLLADAIAPTDTLVQLAGAQGLDTVEIGRAALLGAEVVRVDAVDAVAAQLTLARGCSDTVPTSHAAGTALLVYEDHGAVDATEYLAGTTVLAKLLPRTGAGVLAEAAAPAGALTIGGRAQRPYPPGDLRVAGLRYPTSVAVPPVLTWSHRDRLLQADQLVDTLAGSIGPEPGTSYRAVISNADTDDVLSTVTGVAGQGWSPPIIPGNYRMRARVWAVRDGNDSWQPAEHEFDFSYPSIAGGATLSIGAQLLPGAATNGNAVATGAVLDVAALLAANSAYVDDLVLLLPFSGTSGSTSFPDGGPLGRSVTSIGGVTIQAPAVAPFGSSSAEFEPESGAFFVGGLYLGLASGLPEYLNFDTTSWTVQGWAQMHPEVVQFATVLAIEVQPPGGDGRVFGMSLNFATHDGHSMPSWTFNNVLSTPQQAGELRVPHGEAFHFAFVCDQGKHRAFIKGRSTVRRIEGGVLADFFYAGGTVLSSSQVVIGKSMISGAMRGRFQGLSIHKAALYRSDFTPPVAPVTYP